MHEALACPHRQRPNILTSSSQHKTSVHTRKTTKESKKRLPWCSLTLKQNIRKSSVEYSGLVSSAVEYGKASGLKGSGPESCTNKVQLFKPQSGRKTLKGICELGLCSRPTQIPKTAPLHCHLSCDWHTPDTSSKMVLLHCHSSPWHPINANAGRRWQLSEGGL